MNNRANNKILIRRIINWLDETFDGVSVRSKLIFGWFSFYTGLAISMAIALLNFAEPIPDVSKLSWEKGGLIFDYASESVTFHLLNGEAKALCRSPWMTFRNLSKELENHQILDVELNLYVQDFENTNSACFKAYGLKVNSDLLVGIEDVRDSTKFKKRLYRIIAILAMLYGAYEILTARRKRGRKQRTNDKILIRRIINWLDETFDGVSVRSKLIFGWFSFYTGLAITIATALLNFAEPIPDVSKLSWEKGGLTFDYASESVTFHLLNGETKALCRSRWMAFSSLSKKLEDHQYPDVELNLYVPDLENTNSDCFKAYGLKVNSDLIVGIEDARDSIKFKKRLYRIIAILAMLYGAYEILTVRRIREREQSSNDK